MPLLLQATARILADINACLNPTGSGEHTTTDNNSDRRHHHPNHHHPNHHHPNHHQLHLTGGEDRGAGGSNGSGSTGGVPPGSAAVQALAAATAGVSSQFQALDVSEWLSEDGFVGGLPWVPPPQLGGTERGAAAVAAALARAAGGGAGGAATAAATAPGVVPPDGLAAAPGGVAAASGSARSVWPWCMQRAAVLWVDGRVGALMLVQLYGPSLAMVGRSRAKSKPFT